MKIACTSCGAKYSIADEKVAGRTFELRCKRCSRVIVVSGEARHTARSVAPEPTAEWHVLVGGEQRGPMTPAQIGELLCASELDWEALAWRDGMEGWVALRDLASLVAQITRPERVDSVPPASRAAASPARSRDLFAPATATATTTATTTAATGSRNESSVLFSLANLQSLASARPAGGEHASNRATATAEPAASAPRDGSGLIDIRALVAAQAAAPASPSHAATMLSIGTAPPSFAPLLGPPVLMPAKKERSSKGLLLGAGLAAVACVAVIAAVVAISIIRPAEPAFASVPAAPAARDVRNSTVPARAALTTSTPHAPALAPSGPTATAAQALPAPPPANAEHRARDRRSPGNHAPVAAHPAQPTSAPPSPANAHPTTTADRGVDRVLADMFGDGPSNAPRPQPATHDAPREQLPVQPDREQVLAALRAVQTEVRACGTGQHGTAMTALSVTGSTGRVSSVSVSGPLQGTPVGACVARAARGAHFPRFSRATFSVTFPFAI